ncbi:hypothetical protein HanXRQr2_Chr15g0677491 [Helianthus annuus]|uniref:Uncharacterized protein n=1 Tax=Helianthus annuus TaxID=4232 RepID=A0A251S5Q7_HELAN|nr:hypothetical protein HanXRQr2_Chr15g0677491 [Helianthus annuus]KAJ0471888.1 hypothetical protein HanHA89_Chr15g0600991 [Helianthus annuus]KAJ0647491.1 hypothetical protein HanLR1_Chr15g0562431 [Helianthus annuus]KAJ0651369.1 hypothetical protein HanOQP8_Chr15g0560241 [Helianthus annuus]KAJ0829943.1 hypothetical protein HanPSC8_Chr15g0649541 [Helianthus annuus]
MWSKSPDRLQRVVTTVSSSLVNRNLRLFISGVWLPRLRLEKHKPLTTLITLSGARHVTPTIATPQPRFNPPLLCYGYVNFPFLKTVYLYIYT